MLDDDFYLSLPENPEEAFPLVVARLRALFDVGQEHGSIDQERKYIIHLFAYMRLHEIAFPMIDYDIPFPANDFSSFMYEIEREVEAMCAAFNLKRLEKVKQRILPTYILSAEQRADIHKHIEKIRKIIAQAELSDNKRDALSKKLNAFADEVDRNRTRIEAMGAFVIAVKQEAITGLKEVEPILTQVDKIIEKINEATEWLAGPNRNRELPSPQRPKRIEGPKQADEE